MATASVTNGFGPAKGSLERVNPEGVEDPDPGWGDRSTLDLGSSCGF